MDVVVARAQRSPAPRLPSFFGDATRRHVHTSVRNKRYTLLSLALCRTQTHASMAQNTLPAPSEIKVAEVKNLDPPQQRIRMEDDVGVWKSTRGYHDYLLFLHRLSESVVGHFFPVDGMSDETSLSLV